jgi:hypothetical protein
VLINGALRFQSFTHDQVKFSQFTKNYIFTKTKKKKKKKEEEEEEEEDKRACSVDPENYLNNHIFKIFV